MAGGAVRNKEETLEILKPFFKLGCSVKRSCEYAGIPESTVATWISQDVTIREKITAWQNEASAEARQSIVMAIKNDDKEAAKWWLERKEKDEFSPKKEVDNSGELTIRKIVQDA